ncbi:MAG: hypothetical protein ACYDBV_13875 [Nitrospiria bacterium]
MASKARSQSRYLHAQTTCSVRKQELEWIVYLDCQKINKFEFENKKRRFKVATMNVAIDDTHVVEFAVYGHWIIAIRHIVQRTAGLFRIFGEAIVVDEMSFNLSDVLCHPHFFSFANVG